MTFSSGSDAGADTWRALFDAAPVGIAVVSLASRFLEVNPALCKMLGRTSEELLAAEIADINVPEDNSWSRSTLDRLASSDLADLRVEKRYRHADGHIVWALVNVVPLTQDGSVDRLLAFYVDISDRVQNEERLRYQSTHDELTGLLNRATFDVDLAREWTLTSRDGIDSYALVADLDGFKQLNDEHGHATGDAALRSFSRVLREITRDTDIVGRLGGDEFGVILVRCGGEAAPIGLTARLHDLAVDGLWFRKGVKLGVSVGYQSLREATSAADALHLADLAMLTNKRLHGRAGR